VPVHRGTTFTNTRVRVDNEEFHNCRFDGCMIVYGGTGGVIMDTCTFNNCNFEFEGAAGNTVKFMSGLYQLSSDLIERTFDNIRFGRV
jgi:hypothetical protein